jgi:membrane protease YdiL (CAAX protease family)
MRGKADPGINPAKKVFLGLNIYILTMVLIQIFYVITAAVFIVLSPDLNFLIDGDMAVGLISLAATFTGLLAAGIYFCDIDKRYGLFEARDYAAVSADYKGSFFNRLSVKTESMKFRDLICLIAAVISAQILAVAADIPIEALLNSIGYTSELSPAATADYTLNWALVIYSVIWGPVIEEIVFRGFVLRGLLPYGKKRAIIISALAFSLMHGDISQLVFTFMAGLILAHAALRFSLGWAVILHVFNNGVLGTLLPLAAESMPEDVFVWAYMAVAAVCLVTAFLYLREISGKGKYAEDKKPVFKDLINIWFIMFFVWEILETALSVSPL